MGICTSAGVIRDFAGPYFVSVGTLNSLIVTLINLVGTYLCLSRVYTRVLTQVQLTYGCELSCELSSNPPTVESIWVTIWVGVIHTGGKSGLSPV